MSVYCLTMKSLGYIANNNATSLKIYLTFSAGFNLLLTRLWHVTERYLPSWRRHVIDNLYWTPSFISKRNGAEINFLSHFLDRARQADRKIIGIDRFWDSLETHYPSSCIGLTSQYLKKIWHSLRNTISFPFGCIRISNCAKKSIVEKTSES